MSDQSQGPGWWQASDGEWYSPEQHPDHRPPAPPIAAPPVVPPPPLPSAPGISYPPPSYAPAGDGRLMGRALAGWLQGLLWAVMGFAAVTSILWLAALGAHQDWVDAPSDFQKLSDWSDTEDAANGFDVFTGVVWLAAFVLLIIWMYQAHKASDRLQPGARKWASGWTIGGWFIPLANFVIPPMVLVEICRIADAPRQDGRVSPEWRQQRVAGITVVFFALLGVAFALQVASSVLADPNPFDADAVDAYYAVSAAGSAFYTAAAVCGVYAVRHVTKALAPKQTL
jgi:hypothetical protein